MIPLIPKFLTGKKRVFHSLNDVLNNQSRENFTLLLIAAKYNNLDTFKYLIEKNCDLYSTCTKMQNSLHYAVLNKNKEFINHLTYLDADDDILR